ncbi:CHAT domain-containing protein [Streptomyces sp. NBC_00868]|uniref:CHAT domain-containing protein n=1 Tax=unclassified Streptomyces TaxID=2593676 RepID=UPI0032455C4B|nr:CHAT domain-containing protein [Streptomyces sp. NBC_00868]
MNISVFDPFGPDAEDGLRDWLAQRNRLDHDEAIIEDAIPLSGLFSKGLRPWTLLGLLPRFAVSWWLARAGRSGRTRIGLYECDLFAALERTLWWKVLAVRSAVVALTVTACLLLSAPGWAAVCFPVTAWALTGWRRPLAGASLAGVLLWAAWTGPALLIAALPAAALVALVRLSLSMLRLGITSQAPADSPVRFLGRFFLLRAMWDSTAARVVLAVDKATHDDRARTEWFLGDGGEPLPDRVGPVLVQCRALAAVARLEFQSAMVLSEEARALAAAAPPGIRGWCALQAGDVLLAAGQPAAAEARWREAVQLLGQGRRARYWAAEAELRMTEALTADPRDSVRCVEGLRLMCRTRHAAMRAGNLAVLARTELLVLRLMHDAGNTVGVVEQLMGQYEQKDGLADLGASVGDHAAQVLLLVTLYLDIIENPQDHPETDRVDEDGRHERYVYAAGLMDNVLRHLSRSRMPLLESQAYAALARIQRAVGMHEEALGNALESLGAVQRVRYQLPTTQWRARWVASHASTYALALDLAAADPALVGELLEIIRAQSVPVESDERGSRLRAVLDALVSSTGLPPALGPGPGGAGGKAAPPDPQSSDPLLTDRTILVRRASWVGGEEPAAVDLDGEIETMFPGGWYWSYARVGEWIYHAVRSPSGDWHAQRTVHAEFAGPYEDLVRHLPVRLPGAPSQAKRLRGSALMLVGADDPVAGESLTAGQVWSRIFDGLGAAMLPEVLREALRTAPAPVPLVLAPTGALALVPVCALTLTPQRLVLDAAQVSYLPSIALLSQRRRITVRDAALASPARDDAAAPRGGEAPAALAVLGPDLPPHHPDQKLRSAVATVPEDSEVVVGPLSKAEFASLLAREGTDEAVLYLAGHVAGPTRSDPGGSGFQFCDGPLGLHDLYRTDDAGAPLYRMPRRVLLAACASLGVYGQPDSGYAPSLLDVPEWLGLGAAVVHGGAEHVYCTLFKLLDSPTAQRIDLGLVEALRHHVEPAAALRAVQRAELQRWRDGRGSFPLAFLAYAYVGLGEGPGRKPAAAPPARPDSRRRRRSEKPWEPERPAVSARAAAPGGPAVPPRPPSRVVHEPFMMMARHGPDEQELADVRHTRFHPDGRIRFTSFDGEVHGPVPVRGAWWTKETLDFANFRSASETEWRIFGLSLYVTDARLVLVADEPDAEGLRLAGHIRYPWANSVGFRPKQSFLNDCEMVVEIQQDGPDGNDTYYRLTLLFERDTDSGELARHLVRRLAAHHLDRGVLPDSVRPEFEALRDAPSLPPPRKGEHAMYRPAAFKRYPYGAEYLLGRPVEDVWLGPGLSPPQEGESR